MRITLAILFLSFIAGARTYYVDCAGGADTHTGGSPAEAWRSIGKASATTFAPGDAILFRRGTICEGSLSPKGSGEDGRPIRIGAYGAGPLPVLNAGAAEAAVKLQDQQYWEIENIETAGGNPYGVFIAARRPARHIVIRNLLVHDVTGAPKRKASGLVVISGPFTDVLVDGVTAYRTSQWAGIYVSGSETRARDIVIRNSIVHDVAGDGIVIFQAENGLIEKSAAWLTGLQERETIGTPNAIWTWSCRNCTVQQNEGFWIDSPGVDGGIYDIDWGNDDNIVQHNYGHDAQGYCAAVFGAGKRITTNSIIRYNVCVNNGRSPKLALRQGDIYTSTWEGGSIDGMVIEHNTVVWNPPIDAPTFQMSNTEFTGRRPNLVSDNIVYTSVSSLIRSGPPVKFERNLYWRPGDAALKWIYGDREFAAIDKWRGVSPTDTFADPGFDFLLHPLKAAGFGAVPNSIEPPPAGTALSAPTGKWTLMLLAGRPGPDARSQLVFVQAALAQYADRGLDAVLVADAHDDLRYDWQLGGVRLYAGEGMTQSLAFRKFPALLLISPAGKAVRRWEGFAEPADLGLTLKNYLGAAHGNPALDFDGVNR